ncbi:tetratricopeptide repeat protein [Gallalistipes aquisgranensis]|uniref:tetratricopeptide repeat protein n=1 Tax=Gallalistipes aquisgranensis TaxID=2779358 RepID=UPI001CF89572|nr:tetratricopeptide repeat protein [Gallalistipes aquisgranensis]MBE5034527.1 tetratricopeptide repeat protein [Gallalistipes aquisgranensis]
MKRLVKVSLILSCMALVLSSCNCYKKMLKKVDTVQTSCTPAVLSLKGSTVTADIKVTFPPKYFDEVAVLKVTPVLVFEGGEIAGTPKFVQGENVKDNYTVIPWKTGGSYTQTVTFPYDPKARLSTLELRMESKCSNKCSKKYREFIPFAAMPVAQGISTVQNDANQTSYLVYMPDNFKKVTTISQDAEILYQINKANVRKDQLTSDQIKMLNDFVKENADKEKVTLGNIAAKGYASPDGPVKFNDELSKKRSETGKEAYSKQLGMDAKYDIAAYGEDWDGFKELVEKSDIKDKELILQVLQMYSSPVKRDEEIKNMSSVFKVLAEEILPQLRRTKLVATADVQSKTDAELKAAVDQNVNSLDLEEMMYAATLYKKNSEKAMIYEAAAKKYNDARAYNNLGVALAKQGKLDQAKKALDQAAKLQSAPEISNNLGVVALAQGNVAEAKKYLSSLNTKDAKRNMALVELAEGNYSEAAKGLSGYNLAVAEVANGNLAKAKTALAKEKSADADYLRAVIAMREGDSKAAIANLKSAFSKKKSLKEKAKTDVEFAKLFGTTEFLAL